MSGVTGYVKGTALYLVKRESDGITSAFFFFFFFSLFLSP